MKIEVLKLNKKYGDQWAVRDLNFTIENQGIVGLLGPNGAGKSTTMKVLTGVISATSGTALINGIDVRNNAGTLKHYIGYLPEANPLYGEMYVEEFLRFIGEAFKIKNLKTAIGRVIEQCGLTREKKKQIKNLSKGYKQRVGLAQAIIHDPEILILDEPTSGLDTNQLVEIRELIKFLSNDKTIIFSSHIMQEVEALCDRVIIIDQGKLIADDSIAMLQSKLKGETIIKVEFEKEPKEKECYRQKLELSNPKWNGKELTIRYAGSRDIRPEIFHRAVENNDVIIRLEQQKQTFENVFQNLTRKS